METVPPEGDVLPAPETPEEVPARGPEDEGLGDTGETEDVPEDLGDPGTQGPAA